MPKFAGSLQEHAKKGFKALVDEGTAAARAALQAALDTADMAARSMAFAVSMRRETQNSLQDLPFDSKALFAEQTDVKLQDLKDSHMTLKTLGLYVLAPGQDQTQTTTGPQSGHPLQI
ncbi:hypothetical protein UY3_11957 [Chelonia mydas]|uniref:Uncharacterized protein n=1 Tax=Chelonia mydas TaxID=8469 RepID=M7AZC2_CHEMY|nr:hypothetical protein UY3_11957 [Chelonia mydas]